MPRSRAGAGSTSSRVRRERVPGAHRGGGARTSTRRPVVGPKEARRLDRYVLLGCRRGDGGGRRRGARRALRAGARRSALRVGDRRDHRDRRAAQRSCSSAAPTGSRRTSSPACSPTRRVVRSRSTLGLRGPNYAPVSACATGSTAIGEAAEVIRRGARTRCSPAASEAAVTPLILAGFCAMRGLAAEDEYPPRASRPFDATRAGFVIGEGACVLVLEELEAARARGAHDLRRGARLRRVERRPPSRRSPTPSPSASPR